MATSARVGGISVGMALNATKFNAGIKKASGTLSGFQKSIGGVKAALGSLGVALSVGAFAKFTLNAMDRISELADASKKLGISTEVLGGIQLQAEEAGVGTSKFSSAVVRMTTGIERASMGLGTMADTYKRLGLSATALSRLTPDQQLMTIAQAIGKLDEHNASLNVTTSIFGKTSGDMLQFLKDYPTAFGEAQEAAKKMGLSIKDNLAKQVDDANDSLARFKKSLGTLGTNAAVKSTPFIDALNEVVEGLGYFRLSKRTEVFGKNRLTPQLFQTHDTYDSTGAYTKTDYDKFFDDPHTRKEIRAFETANTLNKFRQMLPELPGMGSSFMASMSASGAAAKATREKNRKAGEAFKAVFGSALGTVGSAASALGGGVMGMGREFLTKQIGSMGAGGSRAGGVTPGFAFAESGSAESYRQQAGIRRQGEQVAKKHLDVDKQALAILKDINRKTFPTFEVGLG